MSLIERDDDGVTWIDGEAYTPLGQREATFLDVTVEAQKERDDARDQLREAVTEVERLRGVLSHVAQEIADEGYAAWSRAVFEQIDPPRGQ